MRLTRSFNAALLLLLTTTSHADDRYIVDYVYDGDTVKLRNADGEIKLRLNDIDAPERNQACGLKARRTLTQLCKGPNIPVTIIITGTVDILPCLKTGDSYY